MEKNRETIDCQNCKAENDPLSTLCWQCGSPLGLGAEQPTGGAEVPRPIGPAPPPSTSRSVRQESEALIFLGFVLGAIGIGCCCCGWVFGIPAIVLGAIAYHRGDRRGMWVIIVGILATMNVLWSLGYFSYRDAPYYRWVPPLPDPWSGPWRKV